MEKEMEFWNDKLPTLVDYLNEQLKIPPPQGFDGKVVYMHCEEGIDRTGEVAAAYVMRWLK